MGSRKSIVKQVQEKLHKMAAYGQKKHIDKESNGGKPALDKIYSYSTMQNYIDASARFAKWARIYHGCRSIDEAKQYTGEYLQGRIDEGMSAWTVRRDAAALAKLYQCQTTDLGTNLPVRHRGDVTQHRQDTTKGQFSETRNQDLVDLCRATGLRRHEVQNLSVDDVRKHEDGSVTVHVRQGKGGKERTITVLNDAPARIMDRAKQEGRSQIIEHIPNRAPIHKFRAEFAQALYDREARPVESLCLTEVYRCRGDMKGKVFDRKAMETVSKALGHERLSVVTSYLH